MYAGVISVIKMVLHSERIVLLSMFHMPYLNVYYTAQQKFSTDK